MLASSSTPPPLLLLPPPLLTSFNFAFFVAKLNRFDREGELREGCGGVEEASGEAVPSLVIVVIGV